MVASSLSGFCSALLSAQFVPSFWTEDASLGTRCLSARLPSQMKFKDSSGRQKNNFSVLFYRKTMQKQCHLTAFLSMPQANVGAFISSSHTIHQMYPRHGILAVISEGSAAVCWEVTPFFCQKSFPGAQRYLLSGLSMETTREPST